MTEEPQLRVFNLDVSEASEETTSIPSQNSDTVRRELDRVARQLDGMTKTVKRLVRDLK